MECFNCKIWLENISLTRLIVLILLSGVAILLGSFLLVILAQTHLHNNLKGTEISDENGSPPPTTIFSTSNAKIESVYNPENRNNESITVTIPIYEKCKNEFYCRLGIDITFIMNPSLDPCTNFYQYSTQKWSKYISSDSFPAGNLDVFDKMELDIKRFVTSVFENDKPICMKCSAEQKARDFYLSCKLAFPAYENNELGDINLKELCTQETINNFPDVVSRMYIMATKISPKKISDVQKVFKNIKRVYKALVSNITWMNVTMKQDVLVKLDKLSLIAGYSQNIMKENIVDDRYRLIFIKNDTYYKNLKELKPYLETADRFPDEDNVIKAYAYFDTKDDKIVLHDGILQYPIHDIDFPNVIKYARIGFIIAHEIAHAFHQYYEYKPEEVKFKDPRKCIEKYYVNGKITMEENFADIIGLKAAYIAMKNFAGSDDHKKIQELKHFTANKLFFIAWAQMFAAEDGSKRIMDAYSSNIQRVQGGVAHSREFSNTFHCQEKHRSKKKLCDLS